MDRARALGLEALEVHRALTSTNDRARAWIREGVRSPALVVAEEQTAGRGRMGRGWVSPPGAGVWMSVIVDAVAPEIGRLIPLRTGLGLAERLSALLQAAGPGPEILLKWPNDLWSERGKVGGILCEAVRDRIVIGVGINLVDPKVDAPYPVAGIGPVAPVEVMRAAVEAAKDAVAHRSGTLHPLEIEAWIRRDLLAGRRVCVDEGPDGWARGIDPLGHLVLAVPGGGERTVASGSVRPMDGVTWTSGS
jgi:BirA family biotin operon repressor/biotin-[acetyl-CoA-carboxylase] ligase